MLVFLKIKFIYFLFLAICKQLQNEENLLPANKSSSDDEEKRYMRRYDEYYERRNRSTDKEFSNRGVRPAPDKKKVEVCLHSNY